MKKILTLKEVQEMLQLSRSKTYQLAKEGTIPTFKIGKSYRVFEDELLRWITT